MTATGGTYAALPRTGEEDHPQRRWLSRLRWLGRAVVRVWVDVRQHQQHLVPADGPVIFAANHLGVADGPILGLFAPRPVHTLTKEEMFVGPLGPFLRAGGQIPLDRFHADPSAMRQCLAVLRAGNPLGVFPEGARGGGDLGRFHRGAAYLALVSGAPVVPVTFFGTRAPGAGAGALPPFRATVDMVYGEPWRIDPVPWPRTREQVEYTSLLLREHMSARLSEALALTGRELPGPLPAGETDDDPDTGVLGQGEP